MLNNRCGMLDNTSQHYLACAAGPGIVSYPSFHVVKSLYISLSHARLDLHTNACLVSLRQAHNSPLSVPRPLPGLVVGVLAVEGLELLVLARLEANDDVGLASAKRQNVDARAGAERTNGLGEGCGGIPVSLRMLVNVVIQEKAVALTSPVSLR